MRTRDKQLGGEESTAAKGQATGGRRDHCGEGTRNWANRRPLRGKGTHDSQRRHLCGEELNLPGGVVGHPPQGRPYQGPVNETSLGLLREYDDVRNNLKGSDGWS